MLQGAVDISPRSELQISGEQLRDLWARARQAGVLVRVVELRDGPGFLAVVDGQGRRTTSTSDHPYKAAIAALGKAA